MTEPHDAAASPSSPAGLRSIFERMTKPTPGDLQTSDRLRHLSRAEIERIMTFFGTALEHLAAQRDDVMVTRSNDAISWDIHVELKPNVVSPVQLGGQ